MYKFIGALLFMAGLSFIVWHELSFEFSFGYRLLLNILGFMVMSIGTLLWKTKAGENPFIKKKKGEEVQAPEKEKPERNQEKENPDRFMPK